MNRGAKVFATTAVLAIAACGGEGKLQIRSTPTPMAAGERPVSHRIAEARGQLALGNAGLALEGFRKAARGDPNSVDAFAGMAACYDLMGRYDLSRGNYEAALALAPGDVQVLGAFAASLRQQGRAEEAANVRAEIAARSAMSTLPQPQQLGAAVKLPQQATEAAPAESPVVTAAETQPVASLPEFQRVASAVGRSVTVKLPPARAVENGPRLERLSMGEIALITTPGPLWRATTVEQSPRSTKVRFVPLRQASAQPARVQLLNAARVDRLAARTRAYLTARGWRGITIGDAAAARPKSIILYPAKNRELARKLSEQFGFAMAPRASGTQVTVLLGRDATRLGVLRPNRA